MKFSDFDNSNESFSAEENNGFDNIKNEQKNKINDLYSKYSRLSQNELLREFFKESVCQKQNGNLSDDKIESMKNVLFPYLSQEQRDNFNTLINMVKDDK